MPTTFNWIYLGTAASLDPTEGNNGAENAASLVGTTFGTTGNPLYTNIVSATMIDNGGTAGSLDNNNTVVNDQFSSRAGPSGAVTTYTYDSAVNYNITVTYADGTTATVNAVIAQSTTGQLFLAPETINNTDTTVFQAKPILSITITSVLASNGNLIADRFATGWDDFWVEGTAASDLINSAYVEPVANGSDRIDNNDGITAASMNDDRIRAGAGNDTVLAGLGNDLIYGGTGNDSLSGEAGLDTIYGEDGNDQIFGGAGNDLLYGGIGNDSLDGGTENDTLFGESGIDSLFGGTGSDSLDGGADNDFLFGGAGIDTLLGGLGADSLDGGSENDTLLGDAGNDTLVGGLGADSLDGGADNDFLFGGDGIDTLLGGLGADSLDGGIDNDQLFGGDGIDTLLGGTGRDVLYGGAGADSINGGADQDTIYGDIGDSVDGGNTGADFDVLDLTAWGKALTNVYKDPLNPENGYVEFLDSMGVVIGTMTFSEIETVIPCFTPGTLILTDRGEVKVEELRVGDQVVTRDGGPQRIRWIGRKDLSLAHLVVKPALRPVLIPKGTLGAGLPARDMRVSPQHRVLVEGPRAEMLFGEPEVLIAAAHLVGHGGVRYDLTPGVAYIHVMFDAHEIVCSDGIWTESFQPASRTVEGMDAARKAEIMALFPSLADSVVAFPAARVTLKAHEARVLLAA